ncbi:MAG TPA: class I adenylate-forming enzyme family protein [Acidimicrobiales bacterium]|nr:class I adenylate-forming enzyme family protein [Acidimicrobiales bacterium]
MTAPEPATVPIGRRIRDRAAEHPSEIVLVHVSADGREQSFTWPELDRRSTQLAGALAERGLGLGDLLGIGLRNSPQFVLAAFAAWKVGAVPVPMRWDLPEWELGRLREAIGGKVHLDDGDIAWIDATAERTVQDLPAVTSPQFNGICSSGSTGLPKVILSNRPGVFDPVLATPFAERWGRPIPRPQTVLVLGPMYHANGFQVLTNLLGGDRGVVLERFDAGRALDAIEKHGVSMFYCTPTMLKRIADAAGVDERDLSSIEWICQGAAPMPPYLVHRWAGLIGADRVIMSYGMSEGLGITALRADEWMAHEGSVGRPMRDTEVRVLDGDGRDAAPGQIGEIYLRSPRYGGSTYLGGSAQPTMNEDGYCSVGDLGYLDEDGFLYVVDRRVDLIITGGANVYPAEVEIALMEHPKVADVVVIGVKDEEWGRRVHAIIEPSNAADPPTYEELRTYAKGKLHPFKVPKSIEIVDAIPRSAATKVNRGALIEARGG